MHFDDAGIGKADLTSPLSSVRTRLSAPFINYPLKSNTYNYAACTTHHRTSRRGEWLILNDFVWSRQPFPSKAGFTIITRRVTIAHDQVVFDALKRKHWPVATGSNDLPTSPTWRAASSGNSKSPDGWMPAGATGNSA